MCKPEDALPNLARRRFVAAMAAGGVMANVPPCVKAAFLNEAALPNNALSGTEFDLTIAETEINITGTPRKATTVNGMLPAPTLNWREGDTITLRVSNRLDEPTSIHWHGILPPYDMDGVPGISFAGIAPGETFTYRFKVEQSGTYWYHSHSGMQEQTGLYGAIIVKPAAAEAIKADRDCIVLLSDWTDEDPMTVYAKLKKDSSYYNFNQPTFSDFVKDTADSSLQAAIAKRHMWNMMRMNQTDLSDISAYTYIYLLNGKTPEANWTSLFTAGERIRLRFINAGAMTFFDVRIPDLPLQVVQTDGQNIEPVIVDEFRIGPAETYDVIVEPQNRAYTVFAQAMDRTGYARGTITPHAGLTAAIPALDKAQPLTMADMMGAMEHAMAPGDADETHESDHGHSLHSNHAPDQMAHSRHLPIGTAAPVRHASSEYGASVDMRVDTPRINLDDPGIGLRNNGRRVLTYADLRTIGGALDKNPPAREIELHLTGNMERYTWSFDGLEFSRSSPVHLRHRERTRIIIVNDTMMTHPLHLHGMWCELETPNGEFQVRKHTLTIQPAQRISFLVTPEVLGRWAWHCHLSLHMHAGMMREVVVA
ncbi:MAG: copper resistance protein CopA [Methylobacter sp.]|nr:MAG: copper resistance protein CopA [Methylobacter sp.]PPD31899.1 MAG: copper resistance protein CopA [Methylomonas sp.]